MSSRPAETRLGISSSDVDQLRARSGAKFVLRVEAIGRCSECSGEFPQPLLLSISEGYSGDGGQIVGVRILKPRCAACAGARR